jgi:Flp pilus assembly protein TadG
MVARLFAPMETLIRNFTRRRNGSVVPLFALALIPIFGTVGAAVDYSRANSVRAKLQAAADSAIFAGISDGTTNWKQTALNVFLANSHVSTDVTVATPSFSDDGKGNYSASANAVVTTMFGLLGVTSINVAVIANAAAGAPESSCILALDHGQPLTHQSVSFDKAKHIKLAGCSIRSNTSIDCTGVKSGASAAIAAGNVTHCSDPQPNSALVTDIYAPLAANIVPLCGTQRGSTTWTAGVLPVGPNLKTASPTGYNEYHICGDVTLTGNGNLLGGSAPSVDTVIVIENGKLTLANQASISASRTTIVLTGGNAYPSSVNFPSDINKQATLSLTPSTSSTNPWQGVSLYQDPALTNGVDNSWDDGANLKADGVIYLPRSNLSLTGKASSHTYNCSKMVVNTISATDKVQMDFQQVKSGCTDIGIKQPPGSVTRLI